MLWSYFAGAGVNAPPASYTVGGKQYIVVGAGGNTTLKLQARQKHHRVCAKLILLKACFKGDVPAREHQEPQCSGSSVTPELLDLRQV